MREGFSWGALLFGPLWLAVHRAWIAAALTLAAGVLIVVLAEGAIAAALLAALIVLLGLPATICAAGRWTIAATCCPRSSRRAARSRRSARLLDRRPDLAGSFLPPETAR